MNTTVAFFQHGDATDPGYRHVRDLPNWREAKDFTESLWSKYRHLADPHFLTDARNHFLQRFWEMYLACTLLERGMELHRVGNEGPEFFFLCGGRRIWIEAIAPGPGTGPDRVPETEYGKAYTVPTDKILLRYTSALRDKNLKRQVAVSKGILLPEEQVVLAINSGGIPHAPYRAEMPYIAKALLPFGALTIGIDPKTREVTDSYYRYRPELQKNNRSAVSTTAFLGTEYTAFAGVLHSGVDFANYPATLGDDFLLIHNPSATSPLPRTVFAWCRQLEYFLDRLNEVPRVA